MSMERWNVCPPSTEADIRASASGNCSCICLIRFAARRDGRYQAMPATSTMAMTEPIGEPVMTPTMTARARRWRS